MSETATTPKTKDIGAFWSKTSHKDGKKFLSGNVVIEGKKHYLTVFKNGFKKDGSQEPDYRIYPSDPPPQKTTPKPVKKVMEEVQEDEVF